MAERLQRLTNSVLPLASVLALAIGPAAAAAEAHYALHAWTAKSKAAAKAKSPDPDTKSEDPSQPKKDHSSERTLSSFFAPASAKPSDTQSKAGGPIIAEGRPADRNFIVQVGPIVTGSTDALAMLHRPSHQANAPPVG